MKEKTLTIDEVTVLAGLCHLAFLGYVDVCLCVHQMLLLLHLRWLTRSQAAATAVLRR